MNISQAREFSKSNGSVAVVALSRRAGHFDAFQAVVFRNGFAEHATTHWSEAGIRRALKRAGYPSSKKLVPLTQEGAEPIPQPEVSESDWGAFQEALQS